MAIIRWEPARQPASLHQEINRLFGSFFDSPAGGSAAVARRWVPAVDLLEEEGQYVLRADLPGLGEEDVKIEVEDHVLSISGERSSEHEHYGEGYRRVERASGSFRRSLRLPEGIEEDAIEARFENGVLEVVIPKPEQRKPHRVEIKAQQQQQSSDAGEPAAA